MSHIPTGECVVCGYRKRVNKNGEVYNHTRPGYNRDAEFTRSFRHCSGSLVPPIADSVRVTEDPPDVPYLSDAVADVSHADEFDIALTRYYVFATAAVFVAVSVTVFLLIYTGVL